VNTDEIELILKLFLGLYEERRTLGKLLSYFLDWGNIMDFTLTDLLPEQFGVSEEQDHVLFFESYCINMLLKLFSPVETFIDMGVLVFETHFAVLRYFKAQNGTQYIACANAVF
jgi:hypothetical protein